MSAGSAVGQAGMPSFLGRIYGLTFLDRFVLIFPLYTVMFVDAGLKPVEISICLIAWSLTTFVLQVPSGVLADRWSRRRLLALAQLVRGAGFLVWLAWPHFWGFLAGLMLWGVKSAFTQGTFEALLYDELKARGAASAYTRIYGRARAVQSIGVLLAALGAAVVARLGYPAILVASLASVVVAAAVAISLPSAPPAIAAHTQSYVDHLRAGLAMSLREPVVLNIMAFSAVVLALGAALEEFWPIFGAKVGLTRPVIALFVGGQNAVEALVSLVAHRAVGLPTRIFYALFSLGGLVLLAAAGLFNPPAMLLLALYSGLMKLVAVVFEGRLQNAIASDRRATIGSVRSFLAQIGTTVLYVSFGPTAQATSYQLAFMLCGAAGLAIGAAYLALSQVRRAPAT